MRSLRIILNTIFLVLGTALLLMASFSKQPEDLFVFILLIYSLGTLAFSVLRELVLLSFPRHFGMLFVISFLSFNLITKDYTLFKHDILIAYITTSSALLAFYFLLLAVIGKSINFSFSKIKASSFRNFYKNNYLIYLLIILSTAFFFYFKFSGEPDKLWHYSLAIMLALFPHFNKNFIRGFASNMKLITDGLKMDISFNQLGKMARIRNFVFSKERLIETGDYQLIESDYRSTMRIISTMQLALKLATDWNRKYVNFFVTDDYENFPFKYRLVEKNENGICVIDDTATMYHFGTYAFVKEKIKRNGKANLFLLKNDLPIAKFVVNEKIADEKVELVNQLDYFGNTILFDRGIREDLGRDYAIVFDKIYSGLNDTKKHDLLKELNKKAPTAFFVDKNPDDTPNALSFYVTTKTDVEKNERLICCNSESLLSVPSLIKFAKKMHTLLRYAQVSSFVIQILLIVFAILNYKNLMLIMAINISIASVVELVTKFFSKKLHYLPDQPAILAQSHQAA